MARIAQKSHRSPRPPLQRRVQTQLPLQHFLLLHHAHDLPHLLVPAGIVIDHGLLRPPRRPRLVDGAPVRMQENDVVQRVIPHRIGHDVPGGSDPARRLGLVDELPQLRVREHLAPGENDAVCGVAGGGGLDGVVVVEQFPADGRLDAVGGDHHVAGDDRPVGEDDLGRVEPDVRDGGVDAE